MSIRAADRRYALGLLASSPEGLTVSLLFYAHSVPIGVLVGLINEGHATVQVLRRRGRPRIEVTTLRITDAGREALT